jgi:pyruvate/2-oxoacid:ferredoxin oxidoreductase alpha subunit
MGGVRLIKVITGNDAAAYGALLSQPKVVCAYPITPQSQIPEQISEFHAQGLLKGKFINVESEMAALGYVTGASIGGVRVFTATSSQGLAWMHEGLHWAAGARLPIVMANVNRPFGAPWNLTCDQIDSLAQRDTGWMQFYCESNQEILDTVIQAYRIAEQVSLPAMVCLDGVYLSYLSESVDIPDQTKVDEYLPPYDPRFKITVAAWKLLDVHPPIKGGYDLFSDTGFMGDRYELHKLESQCVSTAVKANEEFYELFGRSYPPVEEYKCDDADLVVVCSGSPAGTCRQVINNLRDQGRKVGLVKMKMFRPFPKELVRKALSGRKKVAVIERDLSPGQCGIFFQEIKWALNINNKFTPIYGFVSGLGGADITPALIEKAILYTMEKEPPEQEVIWLGLEEKRINDDYDKNTIKIH